MKNLLLIFIFFLIAHNGIATAYYFSSKGDDRNDGKSVAAAWKSLEKISKVQHLFRAGDSLLFECGSVFKGQINVATSGLYLGAYGFGAKPVISGSLEILEWVEHDRNIWKAECLNCTEPANLFMKNIAQTVGRYPNTGYLTISATSTVETSITDASMLFKDGYWNGAEMVVRSGRWTIDNLPVKAYNHKTFTTSLTSSYPLQPGKGYFLQKHLATLDQPGEWFYQASTKQIYLYLKSGVNPKNEKIRVSVLDFGLTITNEQNVIIENLTFAHQQLAGVIVKGSKNISLQRIDILNSGKNGLEIINCENPCVENSFITNANNNGVEWHNNTGGTFSYNAISCTGIYPGRGASGDGTYIALRITSDTPAQGSNSFEHNTIDSTGYSGIDFRTGNTIIKNNNISNFCLIKDDGGGIYTWENTFGNTIIESNTISNGVGSGEGTINP
ncbi:MAG TPA: right-handed parallel beta-helix repeat-containing protein, partial [Bacteroidia bacterium]|nr:right-handed parallel beta-helix repeat-containing protein [Bacteroidia bacterium]